jgi:hypothetical protein
MQGFIVVEAFAEFPLKTFSKALEVAGFDSFSARLPEWLRSVVVHIAALFQNKMVDLDCQRNDLMRFSSPGALMDPIRAQSFTGPAGRFRTNRDECIIDRGTTLAQNRR